jgi:hypothetical protein
MCTCCEYVDLKKTVWCKKKKNIEQGESSLKRHSWKMKKTRILTPVLYMYKY